MYTKPSYLNTRYVNKELFRQANDDLLLPISTRPSNFVWRYLQKSPMGHGVVSRINHPPLETLALSLVSLVGGNKNVLHGNGTCNKAGNRANLVTCGGGAGPYLWSLEHLGRCSEVKCPKNWKKGNKQSKDRTWSAVPDALLLVSNWRE